MNSILLLLAFLVVFLTASMSLLIPRRIIHSTRIRVSSTTDVPFEKWSNPKYDESQIDSWYIEIDKALLTVGAKGVTPSGINSLTELLKQHERVKVKIASDKLDPMKLSEEFSTSSSLKDSAELLQVRKRGFLFAAKNFIQKAPKAKRRGTSATSTKNEPEV
jgi:RNA-binding protein YhbY